MVSQMWINSILWEERADKGYKEIIVVLLVCVYDEAGGFRWTD